VNWPGSGFDPETAIFYTQAGNPRSTSGRFGDEELAIIGPEYQSAHRFRGGNRRTGGRTAWRRAERGGGACAVRRPARHGGAERHRAARLRPVNRRRQARRRRTRRSWRGWRAGGRRTGSGGRWRWWRRPRLA
jgi:hypothetical protein